MTPIIRWFTHHVSQPLERIYARIEDDAVEITPQEMQDEKCGRRPGGRIKRAS